MLAQLVVVSRSARHKAHFRARVIYFPSQMKIKKGQDDNGNKSKAHTDTLPNNTVRGQDNLASL